MYLKSLEIQGFKSFPDKTVLQFGSDITAIVGPNGSGKSNISDAITWVMGEQSSRALRGAKMEDVIFGGTQKRAPVGYAEATLILDNIDGSLRIETPEVMITRRYYRSGESEYYINRQSARLKDINELLMDTGLGREGYSNIGQGKVDEILSVKSTDRREVFEEAAGISKYRHRKEETERRLANTEDNLLRIGDKIQELELQVEPLREQAEKAKKYLILREEQKGLEVTVWLDALEKVAANAKKAEEDYASAAFILEQAHEELTGLYAQAEQLATQLSRETLELDQKREAITAMEQAYQKQEAELSLLQADIGHKEQNIDRVQHELQEQASRSGGIADQISQQEERIEQIKMQLIDLNEQLQKVLTENQQLTERADAAGKKSIELRAAQTLLRQQAADKQAQIASLTASLESVLERKQNLQADHAAATVRREEIERQAADCAKQLHEAEEAVTAAKNTIAGYELRLRTRATQRDEAQKKLNACGVALDTADSKIRMFREMEREYEGFSKAVRIVMQEAGHGSLRNIHGPVSKLIQTDDELTTAIETALGAAMQNIVVDTEEDGKAAIQLLKRRDGGRATFLPLRAISGKRLQENGLENLPGFVGVASELVKTDANYRNIIENLLGRIVIVETLDQAIRMARSYNSRFKIVTLDGQVMNAGGSMTGGSSAKSAGVLSRANALQRLEQERTALEKQRQQLQTEYQQAATSAAKTEFELTTVQGQLRQAEDEVLRRTEEEKQVKLLLGALCENLDSYERELQLINSRNGSDAGRLDALQQDAAQAQTQLDALDGQLETILRSQSELSVQAAAVQQTVTDLKMQAAAGEAERTSAQESIRQLQSLAEAMQGDRAQKQALIEGYRREIETQTQYVAEKQRAMAQQKTDTEALRQTAQQSAEHRNLTEQSRTKTEKLAQDKNKDILLLEREAARLEQKKATGELEEKQLVDKLWDSYELTPSTAQQAKVEIESIPAANRRIGEVRRKISSLGTPNLGAIDEFERVNERYEYLSGQRDDVEHSKKELEEIVKSITQEMTEIFVREFEKINAFFGETFVEMFGGGKASLELENQQEPLSCGIEIRVQPPGKQVKTITLLSGGEKAFVAIALYFAILKVRPTPFCMVDEIDAALDDRNVERFAAYLHNLCSKTQFIVVTHRRGTMEAADVLYGVTMQEQGISKVLHLNLGEMEQQLGITG